MDAVGLMGGEELLVVAKVFGVELKVTGGLDGVVAESEFRRKGDETG